MGGAHDSRRATASEAGPHRVAIAGVGLMPPATLPRSLALPAGLGAEQAAFLCPADVGKREIPARKRRRLGRLQRIGLAAGLAAAPAARPAPERVAVCVGTGMGAAHETVSFVENMVAEKEKHPQPTRFINSVHNSLAAQLAQLLDLRGENHTFTHNAISFELALDHAALLLATGRAEAVLCCGADSLVSYVAATGRHFDWWTAEARALRPLREAAGAGTLPGEGAAAFWLTRPGEGPACRVRAAGPLPGRFKDFPQTLQRSLGEAPGAGDFLLLGANGDATLDARYDRALAALPGEGWGYGVYKQACGEFCTATGLALGHALASLAEGAPASPVEVLRPPSGPLRRVFIVHLSRSANYSVLEVGR